MVQRSTHTYSPFFTINAYKNTWYACTVYVHLYLPHDTPSLSFAPFPSLTEPTGPPTSFHVVVLNTTAIEVQWNLPLRQLRNGIIRGYKLFVQQQRGRQERIINIAGSGTTEYIVSGLEPGTAYVVSALAYTVGDGPRSIHLTVLTPLVSEWKQLTYRYTWIVEKLIPECIVELHKV